MDWLDEIRWGVVWRDGIPPREVAADPLLHAAMDAAGSDPNRVTQAVRRFLRRRRFSLASSWGFQSQVKCAGSGCLLACAALIGRSGYRPSPPR